MRGLTGERAFKCTKCDNRFSSSSNLENYKRTPTVGKLWVHNVWHELLIRIWWIEETGRDHTGETQLKCRKCGKSVSESGGLKKHKGTLNWGNFMRGLTRERTKAIQVLQMWQYFSLSNNLRNHYRTLTVEKLSVQGLAWASQDQMTCYYSREAFQLPNVYLNELSRVKNGVLGL